MNSLVKHSEILRYENSTSNASHDLLVVEEPLEIRLGFGPEKNRQQRSLSVTMRTPGHDFELAVGFLFTEGIIRSCNDIISVKYCEDGGKQEKKENIVRVELQPEVVIDFESFQRHFYTSSSCGVCGKSSIKSVTISCKKNESSLVILSTVISSLPDKLREAQKVFEYTGGLHASGLFSPDGKLILLREDVGRHNALDKLIGACLANSVNLLHESILLVSGRTSFELVQKAAVAGIPVLVAVGAPSSLAVELARDTGMTLIGFVRDNRFNVYSGRERVSL